MQNRPSGKHRDQLCQKSALNLTVNTFSSKPNSRLGLRRASIDASPRTTPTKNNLSSNLFGEDFTPIITCALKKRFDALNFSFEENKENQEPFFS